MIATYSHSYNRRLNTTAFEKDKGTDYTRTEPPIWTNWVKVCVRGMVKAGNHLFVAGPPDVFDAERPCAALEGKTRTALLALSAENGETLSETELESPPVFDGMIAAHDALYMSLDDGSVVCMSDDSRGRVIQHRRKEAAHVPVSR